LVIIPRRVLRVHSHVAVVSAFPGLLGSSVFG
jgi:hypothetical protein